MAEIIFNKAALERLDSPEQPEDERQMNALFELAMIAKHEIANDKGMTLREALAKLRIARTRHR